MEMNACMIAPAAVAMPDEDMENLRKKRIERKKNAGKGYFNI